MERKYAQVEATFDIEIPRFVGNVTILKQCKLVFCDISIKTYATVLYFHIESKIPFLLILCFQR